MYFPSDTLLVYQVSKKEVVNREYSSILEFIKALSDEKINGRSKMALIFHGYDDVPDELYEIKEVREYIQELFMYVPHLLYFINLKLDHHIYLLASLGDVESFHVGPHQYGAPKIVKIILQEKFYVSMKKGIESYCDSIGDQKSKKELLELLERFVNG